MHPYSIADLVFMMDDTAIAKSINLQKLCGPTNQLELRDTSISDMQYFKPEILHRVGATFSLSRRLHVLVDGFFSGTDISAVKIWRSTRSNNYA